MIAGLTGFANRGHIARAVLEATAYQTREVLKAMQKDTGVLVKSLQVDGGMVVNELLMQFQSDLLGIPVESPAQLETTALGAVYAAGLAVGFWESVEQIRGFRVEGKCWEPSKNASDMEAGWLLWQKAVQRSLGWES